MNLMESIMEWRRNEIHEVVGWACFLAAGGGYGLAGQPSSAKGRQAKPNNQQQMNGIEGRKENEQTNLFLELIVK